MKVPATFLALQLCLLHLFVFLIRIIDFVTVNIRSRDVINDRLLDAQCFCEVLCCNKCVLINALFFNEEYLVSC